MPPCLEWVNDGYMYFIASTNNIIQSHYTMIIKILISQLF